MWLGWILPLLVALATCAGVALVIRRRDPQAWGPLVWIWLVLGGVVGAMVVRAVEVLVLEYAVGGAIAGNEVRQTLVAFGIVGPFTVLTTAAAVWPMLSRGLAARVDPPLAAAVVAAGQVIGRLIVRAWIEHTAVATGLGAGALAIDEVGIAATWGYGLALSSYDQRPGGTPFGRYALTGMALRGGCELAVRSAAVSEGGRGIDLAIALSIGFLTVTFGVLGQARLARAEDAPPSSLGSIRQESMRELARSQLRRGRVRPLWILIGALANIGGIVLGFVAAALVGRSAKIDFGEIDRNGPAAEYAVLLLALGVVFSFPLTAAIVGIASGGRSGQRHPHVLEAGLAAVVALAVCLLVVGVVAPVGVAIGVACAPVAFVLAGLGAWIASGRDV
jgi:hypothetical protein